MAVSATADGFKQVCPFSPLILYKFFSRILTLPLISHVSKLKYILFPQSPDFM